MNTFLPAPINIDDLPDNENSYEPLPAGDYVAKICKAEVCQAKSGGQYIKLRFDVVGPTHAGRVIFSNINIVNPNETAQRIGLSQLKDLMRAINVTSVSSVDQLIGHNVTIKVSVRKDEQYGDSNDVKAYKPAGAVVPAATPGFTAPAFATQAAPAAPAASPFQASEQPPVSGRPW